MKLVFTLALVLIGCTCSNDFSFLLDPNQIRNVTLEFRTSYRAYKLEVKCDYTYYSYWSSSDYGFVQVTPEQRQSYKCSDSNFTVTVSNDFNKDEIIVFVYDYNTMGKIDQFSFISDQNQVSKNELAQDKATLYNFYYSDKNDYKLSVTIPSTVYVEILQCPKAPSTFNVKVYDINKQYRNLTAKRSNFFYDVFNTTDGDFTYRISSLQRQYPDAFIKYQRTYQQFINYIETYTSAYYQLSAEVRQDRIIVSIPTIYTYNSEPVEFHIMIAYENYANSQQLCTFGDKSLEQQYGSNWYANSQVVTQYSRYSSYQEETLNFPTTYEGNYIITVTAIVDHGEIKQTIPYTSTTVYQSYYSIGDNLLIYILMPIFVSVLALFGMAYGGLRYRYKKKQMEKLEQEQLLEKAQQQAINKNYFGVQ